MEHHPKFECNICLESLEKKDVFYTPCFHKFHEGCLMPWLEQKKFEAFIPCPTCRADISSLLGERDPNTLYRDLDISQINFNSIDATFLEVENMLLDILQNNTGELESQQPSNRARNSAMREIFQTTRLNQLGLYTPNTYMPNAHMPNAHMPNQSGDVRFTVDSLGEETPAVHAFSIIFRRNNNINSGSFNI